MPAGATPGPAPPFAARRWRRAASAARCSARCRWALWRGDGSCGRIVPDARQALHACMSVSVLCVEQDCLKHLPWIRRLLRIIKSRAPNWRTCHLHHVGGRLGYCFQSPLCLTSRHILEHLPYPPCFAQCHETFRCERRCTEMRACGRHQCRRRCCNGQHPPCEEVCNKWLKCRNHR